MTYLFLGAGCSEVVQAGPMEGGACVHLGSLPLSVGTIWVWLHETTLTAHHSTESKALSHCGLITCDPSLTLCGNDCWPRRLCGVLTW